MKMESHFPRWTKPRRSQAAEPEMKRAFFFVAAHSIFESGRSTSRWIAPRVIRTRQRGISDWPISDANLNYWWRSVRATPLISAGRGATRNLSRQRGIRVWSVPHAGPELLTTERREIWNRNDKRGNSHPLLREFLDIECVIWYREEDGLNFIFVYMVNRCVN